MVEGFISFLRPSHIELRPFQLLAQAPAEKGQFDILGIGLLALLIVLVLGAILVSWRSILRLSPRRLWALAAQTVRESVRRRVLLLIPGAMILIVIFGFFQRSFNEVGQIHQAIGTCILVTLILTLLLMVILSAFAFPREFESRTIYSLVTKPVSRVEIFLGKVLGLWLVAGIVLLLMGAFSYIYLNVRSLQLHAQAIVRLSDQKERYDRYVRERGTATQPADDQLAGLARPDPPDNALRQQLDLGLLRAANFIDSAGVKLHPEAPGNHAAAERAWILTRRGYVALYEFDLPPEDRRTDCPLELAVEMPGAEPTETFTATLRMHVPLLPPAGPDDKKKIQVWPPPLSVEKTAGLPVGVGDPMTVTLRHIRDQVWYGRAMDLLSGEFLRALGSNDRLGVSIEIVTPRSRMVGLIKPSEREQGMTIGRLSPRRLQVLPRAEAVQRFALSGTEPGTPPEVAEYRFQAIPFSRLPAGDLVFLLDFTVDKGSPVGADTEAVVIASGAGKTRQIDVVPSSRMGCFVRVPRELAADGSLVLQLRPRQPEDTFTLDANSVRLLARPTNFALNLFKSLLIIMLAAMVVVAIGVMASVFLSWPVALLLTNVVLVAGNMLQLVRGMLAKGTQVLKPGDGQAAVFEQATNVFLSFTAQVVVRIVPDFTQFDSVAFISQGLNIPWSSLVPDVVLAAKCLGVAIAVGVLTLHFREVAR
jgi:hypothetical protein